jgi:hypothetical protein
MLVKLALYCPFYTMPAAVPSAPLLRVLPEEAVLPIFWTLRIVRPMSDEGGNEQSRVSILSFPPNLTRANKESPDMKRAMFSVLTLVILTGLTGCATQHGRHPLLADKGTCCTEGTCAQAAEGCQHGQACCKDPGNNGHMSLGARLAGLCKCGARKERCQKDCEPAPGPATGAVTYPYYTVRGPRDFLAKAPSSIGP